MSSCRCDEMSRHDAKIKKLQNKLDYIKTYEEEFSNLTDDLDNMVKYNLSAFYTSEMSILNKNIKALNVSLEKIRDKIIKKIQNKINQLQSELSKMKEEDEEYHRKQRENEQEGQP